MESKIFNRLRSQPALNRPPGHLTPQEESLQEQARESTTTARVKSALVLHFLLTSWKDIDGQSEVLATITADARYRHSLQAVLDDITYR